MNTEEKLQESELRMDLVRIISTNMMMKYDELKSIRDHITNLPGVNNERN